MDGEHFPNIYNCWTSAGLKTCSVSTDFAITLMAAVMKGKHVSKGTKKNKPDSQAQKLPGAETQVWAGALSISLQVTHQFLWVLSTTLPAAPDWGQQAANANSDSVIFIMQ